MTQPAPAWVSVLGPLWTVGLYRVLLYLAAAEFVLILAQVAWLFTRLFRATASERARVRFEEACGPGFLSAVDGPDQRPAWILEAARWKPDITADYIHTYLLRTEGTYHDAIASLYRDAGLHLHDIRMLRSWRWPRRVRALRRLSEVARPGDRVHVVVRPRDPYPVQVSTLILLARIGDAEDVRGVLATLRPPRRLMEQPLHAALLGLSRPVLATLMDSWDRLPDPIVRRVLLAAAAQRVPNACARWLPGAAAHADPEIRVGACMAAGHLGTPDAFRLLLTLLGDPSWIVRARAASALGQHGEPTAVDALGFALGDPVPWVRQNAATALRLLGEEGLGRLQGVAEASHYPLARRTAEAEIGHSRVLSESRGDKT